MVDGVVFFFSMFEVLYFSVTSLPSLSVVLTHLTLHHHKAPLASSLVQSMTAIHVQLPGEPAMGITVRGTGRTLTNVQPKGMINAAFASAKCTTKVTATKTSTSSSNKNRKVLSKKNIYINK